MTHELVHAGLEDIACRETQHKHQLTDFQLETGTNMDKHTEDLTG